MMQITDILGKQMLEDVTMIADTDIDWSKLEGKSVLITGANGFIAKYLVLSFMLRNDRNQAGIQIVGLVRNKQKAKKIYGQLAEREDLELVESDVCGDLSELVHCDFVIHAASQATPYFFENDPVGTMEANTLGTSNILRYAVKEKPEAVLMISSLKVYGDVHNNKANLPEEDLGELDIDSYKNCYASGKRAMETLCNCYVKQYGLPIKIARPSYIYGASTLEDDRVWAQFLANIIRRQSILLKSNGAAYRSFCYVVDTASALLTILMKGENGQPYNIADEKSDITIRDFAKTAVRVFPERNMTLSFANPQDEAEPELDFTTKTPEILDSTKLRALGWRANIDVAEGIKRAVLTMEETEI